MRLGAILVGGGIAVALTLAVLAPRIGSLVTANASSSAEIDLDELALRSIVYDANGDEFDVLYDVENRELAGLHDISKEALISIIVVEDEGSGISGENLALRLRKTGNHSGEERGGAGDSGAPEKLPPRDLLRSGAIRHGSSPVRVEGPRPFRTNWPASVIGTRSPSSRTYRTRILRVKKGTARTPFRSGDQRGTMISL